MFATTRRRWAWWAVLVAWGLSYAVCIGPAVSGTQHWNVGGLGGFIGAALGIGLRNRDFWRLTPPDRQRVRRAVAAGVPTGSLLVDRVARNLLTQAARSRSRVNDVTLVACAIIAPGVPVIASVRMDNPWYLVALAPTIALIAGAGRARLHREHPAERLTRFDAASATSRTTG